MKKIKVRGAGFVGKMRIDIKGDDRDDYIQFAKEDAREIFDVLRLHIPCSTYDELERLFVDRFNHG